MSVEGGDQPGAAAQRGSAASPGPRARPSQRRALAVLLPALLAGCTGIDFLENRCEAEVVAVVWPVTVMRGATTGEATLTSSVSRAEVGAAAWDQLRGALVEGTLAQDIGVAWNVPAFEAGGGIAWRHAAVLAPDGRAEVQNAGQFVGWGVGVPPAGALATVRLPAPATVVSGTILQVGVAPTRYRILIEAREEVGGTILVFGEATFTLRREPRLCAQ